MKATIIIAAAALTGSVALAEPYVDYNLEGVYIDGNKGAGFITWIEQSKGCVPYFEVYEESITRWIETEFEFRARIDSKPIWKFNSFAEGGEEGLSIYWQFSRDGVRQRFINELRRGINIRVKMSDSWKETFSLMGYSVAYNKLMQHCKRGLRGEDLYL